MWMVLCPRSSPAVRRWHNNTFLAHATLSVTKMKTRTRAVYQDGVLRPLNRLDLRQGEEVEIEITNSVRRTKGIIKIEPELGEEIAESDVLSSLES
jgi:predicted DNA-binding antitoxin AbrB/MazE fold protein